MPGAEFSIPSGQSLQYVFKSKPSPEEEWDLCKITSWISGRAGAISSSSDKCPNLQLRLMSLPLLCLEKINDRFINQEELAKTPLDVFISAGSIGRDDKFQNSSDLLSTIHVLERGGGLLLWKESIKLKGTSQETWWAWHPHGGTYSCKSTFINTRSFGSIGDLRLEDRRGAALGQEKKKKRWTQPVRQKGNHPVVQSIAQLAVRVWWMGPSEATCDWSQIVKNRQ